MEQDIKQIIQYSINDYVQEIVGDTSVPNQLDLAINNHTHSEYVTYDEYNELKKQVEILRALVGDTSVASQINSALQN